MLGFGFGQRLRDTQRIHKFVLAPTMLRDCWVSPVPSNGMWRHVGCTLRNHLAEERPGLVVSVSLVAGLFEGIVQKDLGLVRRLRHDETGTQGLQPRDIDKGKPPARGGRKATGLAESAGPPNTQWAQRTSQAARSWWVEGERCAAGGNGVEPCRSSRVWVRRSCRSPACSERACSTGIQPTR